jgi:hypothetical protein
MFAGMAEGEPRLQVDAVRLPVEYLRSTGAQVVNARLPNSLGLAWVPDGGGKARADIYLYAHPSAALDRFAETVAACAAGERVVDHLISTAFGDVCLGLEDSASVIMVRGNAMLRAHRIAGEGRIASMVRALDTAIQGSVGVSRLADGSRFIYPADLRYPDAKGPSPFSLEGLESDRQKDTTEDNARRLSEERANAAPRVTAVPTEDTLSSAPDQAATVENGRPEIGARDPVPAPSSSRMPGTSEYEGGTSAVEEPNQRIDHSDSIRHTFEVEEPGNRMKALRQNLWVAR